MKSHKLLMTISLTTILVATTLSGCGRRVPSNGYIGIPGGPPGHAGPDEPGFPPYIGIPGGEPGYGGPGDPGYELPPYIGIPGGGAISIPGQDPNCSKSKNKEC